VCLVMATWADKIRVIPALMEGMSAIEPLLRRGVTAGRKVGDVGPAKGSPFAGDRRANPSTMPPPLDVSAMLAASGIPPLPPAAAAPKAPGLGARAGSLPGVPSAPDIHVGEAELGRASMAALRYGRDGSDSSPGITFGDAELGRASLAAVSATSS